MVDYKKILIAAGFITVLSGLFLYAEELPNDEIQAALNGYFDNFRVNIYYPTLSLTKRLSGSTSITGRYLVDAITAASMRSRFDIDGVTSATTQNSVDAVTSASSKGGYHESTFDDVRNEFNAGLLHLVGEGSVSLNALYSTEHDYTSTTLAGQITVPFAKKNTTLQVGVVRSWDKVFPDTRTWTRSKDVLTSSIGLTQVLTPAWIVQINGSVTRMSGYLSEPYQPVPVYTGASFVYHETVLPDSRLRKALGLRSNWMLSPGSSLQLGYRIYQDDWGIQSHTINTMIQKYFADKNITMRFSARYYTQNQADFYQPKYTSSVGYLTVDSKLKDLWSGEFEIGADLKATYFDPDLFLYSENMTYNFSLGFYNRHTSTPDWFSGKEVLNAFTISLGARYQF